MTENLPVISVNDAIKTLESMEGLKDSQALEVVKGALNNQVAALGTDEVFILKSKSGEIRGFKQNLLLSKQNGGLIQPLGWGPFSITAVGYERWRNAANASVIPAKEVLVKGEWKPNPHVEEDPATKRAVAVHCRVIIFGYSPKGLPMVLPWTTIYDVTAYRMIDLLAKAKKYKDAFKALPKDTGPPEEKGTWARYSLDDAVDLWANTSHDEWFEWSSSILNREKKAIDFAQTFAYRNATKHFCGLQTVPGQYKGDKYNPIDQWNIPVISWIPVSGGAMKWDQTQFVNLQNRIERVIEGDAHLEDVEEEDVQLLPEGHESVDPDDMAVDIEDEDREGAIEVQGKTVSEETRPVPEPDETAKTTAKAEGEKQDLEPPKKPVDIPNEQAAKIMKDYHMAIDIEPELTEKAWDALKIAKKDRKNPPPEVAIVIMNKINNLIDETI